MWVIEKPKSGAVVENVGGILSAVRIQIHNMSIFEWYYGWVVGLLTTGAEDPGSKTHLP